MVIFSFICSLVFCLVLVAFIFSLIISFIKAKKMDIELNNKVDELNNLFNNNIGGDFIDKNKEE